MVGLSDQRSVNRSLFLRSFAFSGKNLCTLENHTSIRSQPVNTRIQVAERVGVLLVAFMSQENCARHLKAVSIDSTGADCPAHHAVIAAISIN